MWNSMSQTGLNLHLNALIEKYRSQFVENEQLFLGRVFSAGVAKYLERLEAIDFVNKEQVLDAGCGFGQWALALAASNGQVDACDISLLRSSFLRDLAGSLGITNLNAHQTALDRLPFASGTFDAVFSYSVIPLVPWREVLAEFARIIKPGGTLYLNANDIGWYVFLWETEHNRAGEYDPRALAASAFADTLRYDRLAQFESGMNLIIQPAALENELKTIGFSDIRIAAEGKLHTNLSASPPTPFLIGEYGGLVGVYEVLATKQN
jgi:SAM-dependent methyltransferase